MDITLLPGYRNNPQALADKLSAKDIAQLVELLGEKNDEIRYPCFLALQKRSEQYPDVYPFWPVFAAKMADANSFQRNIGIILLAANVRWDKEKRFDKAFPDYIRHCTDEKFVTCRMTLQSIPEWVAFRPDLAPQTATRLMEINVFSFKESQTKLILIDIVNALLAICEVVPDKEIDRYIGDALTGGVLDKKNVKELAGRMR